MIKQKYSLEVRGENKKWSIDLWADPRHVEDWLEDGLEVYRLHGSIPVWAVNMGLTSIWFAIQDIFNFRWGKNE